jgi:hypothetical protein
LAALAQQNAAGLDKFDAFLVRAGEQVAADRLAAEALK